MTVTSMKVPSGTREVASGAASLLGVAYSSTQLLLWLRQLSFSESANMGNPNISVARNQYAAAATTSGFVGLLLGRFDFSRVGYSSWTPVPLRVLVAVGLLACFVPWWLSFPWHQRLLGMAGRTFSAYALLCAAIIISQFWSPYGARAGIVTTDLVVSLAMLFVAATAFTASADRALETLMVAMGIVGCLYAILGFLSSGSSVSRASVLGGGPNVYGRITALAVLAILYLVRSRSAPSLLLGALPLLIFATVASGSRGAMISLVIGLAIAAPVYIGDRRVLGSLLLVGIPFAALAWTLTGGVVSEDFQYRVLHLTLQEGYTSGRQDLIPVAVHMFLSSPLAGRGVGSFGVVLGYPEAYPHNLILQTAAEVGLLGLCLLAIALFRGALPLCRGWRRQPRSSTLLAMAALMLTASMFSGDYFDSRFLWLFLIAGGAMTGSSACHSKTSRMPESVANADLRAVGPSPSPR